ncbi:MAG: hypothetical protein AB8H86_13790 [Polyangiales bacterium]
MPSEPRLRGAVLLDQIAYITKTHGPAVVRRAKQTMASDDRRTIEETLPISWLSVPTVTRFKSAIAAELGEDPVAFNRRLVRASIGNTISTIWRALLSQLWDSAVVKRTPILYSKAFDRGKLELRVLEKRHAEFVLSGWPDMPEFDCAGMAAAMEALLEYAGRGTTTVRWRREPLIVVFDATWRPSAQ